MAALAQICSPSLSRFSTFQQQNLSSFQYIHSDSRNRLTTKNATDLVWLYSNLRLLKRTQVLEQGLQAVPLTATVKSDEEEKQHGQEQESEESEEEWRSEEECRSDEEADSGGKD